MNGNQATTEDIIRRITQGTAMIEDALGNWVDIVEEIDDTRLPNLLDAFRTYTRRLSEIAVALAKIIREHSELAQIIRDSDGASNEEIES